MGLAITKICHFASILAELWAGYYIYYLLLAFEVPFLVTLVETSSFL